MNMKEIKLKDYNLNTFAENKDIAQLIRKEEIIPALQRGDDVVLDFQGITETTQSFIHALISDLFRLYGSNTLERIEFKNCTSTIKKIIEIVVSYMQESYT